MESRKTIANNDETLERIIVARLLHLNALIMGILTGLVAGSGIFVATNWLVLKGGDTVGPHLSLLAQFFIGYEVTFLGSLIGFGYGFVSGFLVAYFLARMYNWLAGLRAMRARSRS